MTPLTVSQTLRVGPTLQGLGPGLELVGDVQRVDVSLNGPAPTLQTLTPRDFQVVLDLSGLGLAATIWSRRWRCRPASRWSGLTRPG